MKRLLQMLFGCQHKRTGWPITVWVTRQRFRTYIVCLQCGKELNYDWQKMRRSA